MSLTPGPNLRKIAKVARVSHTTVSLALRNHPRVSIRTRQRIQTLAQTMGYRPNALVSALMSHVRVNRRIVGQEIVAFVHGGPRRDWWQEWGTIRENFAGARGRAEQLGFQVEPFWLGPGGQDAAAVAKVLHARAIRGAILAPFPVPHSSISLDWSQCAATALGYSFDQVPLHRATHNHVDGAVTVYRELHALGYRRIGLALSRTELSRVKHYWLAGILTGREICGGERVRHLVFQEERGRSDFFTWLDSQRPDVVVGVARDTFFWLREAGWRMPEDIAYAHLNLTDLTMNEVTGLVQRPVEIGAAAMDLLANQLYHNEYGSPQTPNCTLIDGYWRSGLTAPPC
jgi:LacI family transcriptional regulator